MVCGTNTAIGAVWFHVVATTGVSVITESASLAVTPDGRVQNVIQVDSISVSLYSTAGPISSGNNDIARVIIL